MENTKTLSNGVYLAGLRLYPESKRRVNVFQGMASIYTMQGVFICRLDLDTVMKEYVKFEPKPKPLYNLMWIVNGYQRECVKENVSYALCKFFQRTLKNQYRYGLLMPVPSSLS